VVEGASAEEWGERDRRCAKKLMVFEGKEKERKEGGELD